MKPWDVGKWSGLHSSEISECDVVLPGFIVELGAIAVWSQLALHIGLSYLFGDEYNLVVEQQPGELILPVSFVHLH